MTNKNLELSLNGIRAAKASLHGAKNGISIEDGERSNFGEFLDNSLVTLFNRDPKEENDTILSIIKSANGDVDASIVAEMAELIFDKTEGEKKFPDRKGSVYIHREKPGLEHISNDRLENPLDIINALPEDQKLRKTLRAFQYGKYNNGTWSDETVKNFSHTYTSTPDDIKYVLFDHNWFTVRSRIGIIERGYYKEGATYLDIVLVDPTAIRMYKLGLLNEISVGMIDCEVIEHGEYGKENYEEEIVKFNGIEVSFVFRANCPPPYAGVLEKHAYDIEGMSVATFSRSIEGVVVPDTRINGGEDMTESDENKGDVHEETDEQVVVQEETEAENVVFSTEMFNELKSVFMENVAMFTEFKEFVTHKLDEIAASVKKEEKTEEAVHSSEEEKIVLTKEQFEKLANDLKEEAIEQAIKKFRSEPTEEKKSEVEMKDPLQDVNGIKKEEKQEDKKAYADFLFEM